MSRITVSEYYANKSIFITGASGFIGKVLVEKLLRCCPDIKVIYMLMRKKKGVNSLSRLAEFLGTKVFDNLKSTNPSALAKLKVIPGDILSEDLGMSNDDRKMLQEEVQIVFHSAACVRFDVGLREAVEANLLGTQRVLQLVEGMKNLEVFEDISTSFCHDEVSVLEEVVYPSPHRPQDVISCVKWMSDEMLEKLTPTLIQPYVNTYGYTKCLTEDLVSQYQGKFTIAIARPSIVIAAHKEPMPGWVDNINGPTGVVYAGFRGVLQTVYCKDTTKVDTMPVDLVVNGCILVAYATGLEQPKEIRVCNITQSGINEMTWVKGSKIMRKYVYDYPPSMMLWYPFGSSKNYKFQHKIADFFYHVLAAYFVDFLLYIFGQKTFMVKAQQRLRKGIQLFDYYSTRTWTFKNDYFLSLRNKITDDENDIFYTDMSKVDFEEFSKNYILGVREYICKEDMSTLPKARKLLQRLYYLHVTVKTLLYILLIYFLYVCFKFFF